MRWKKASATSIKWNIVLAVIGGVFLLVLISFMVAEIYYGDEVLWRIDHQFDRQ